MLNDKRNSIKLSVIIPCYNAAKTISVQLEALANQQWSEPWEVIVADNGSTDESVNIVERYKQRLPNLRGIDASAKRGPAHASNVGARAAKGELLVFCDADDEVAPGWLAAISEALSKHDFVASRLEHKKLNQSWKTKNRGVVQQDGLQTYSYPPYLPHASASGLGVKRSIHEAIGGFDENMIVLQDPDYCWRIQLAGTELHFVKDAVVHYRHRHTFSEMYRQSRLWGEYNVYIYKKYRRLGMPKLSPRDILVAVIYWMYGLFTRLLQIRRREDLAYIIAMLGNRAGRIRGCIKYRILHRE